MHHLSIIISIIILILITQSFSLSVSVSSGGGGEEEPKGSHQFEEFSFVVISDIHFGETELKKKYLRNVVTRINQEKHKWNISYVFVTGDITDSGFFWQYEGAKNILDNLTVPFIPLPGNHDLKISSEGDMNFHAFFSDVLERRTSEYMGMERTKEGGGEFFIHNFVLKEGPVAFIGLDWNKRYMQDGGGCVHYFNHTNSWLKKKLKELTSSDEIKKIFILQHEPLTYNKGLWPLEVLKLQKLLVFSIDDLNKYKDLLIKSENKEKIYGILAGHVHEWDSSNPMGKEFPQFVQFDTKAVKLDSSFSLIKVKNHPKNENEISIKISKHSVRLYKVDNIVIEFLGYIFFIAYVIFLVIKKKEGKMIIFFSYCLSPVYFFILTCLQTFLWHHNYEQGFLFYIDMEYAQPLAPVVYQSIFMFFFMAITDFVLLREKNQHKIVVLTFKPLVDSALVVLYFILNYNSLEFTNFLVSNRFRPPEFPMFREKIPSFTVWLFFSVFFYSFFFRSLKMISVVVRKKYLKIKRTSSLKKMYQIETLKIEKKIENSPLINEVPEDSDSEENENDIRENNTNFENKKKSNVEIVLITLLECFFGILVPILSFVFLFFTALVMYLLLLLVFYIFKEGGDVAEEVIDNILIYSFYFVSLSYILVVFIVDSMKSRTITIKKYNKIGIEIIIGSLFIFTWNIWYFSVAIFYVGLTRVELILVEILLGLFFFSFPFLIKGIRSAQVLILEKFQKKRIY